MGDRPPTLRGGGRLLDVPPRCPDLLLRGHDDTSFPLCVVTFGVPGARTGYAPAFPAVTAWERFVRWEPSSNRTPHRRHPRAVIGTGTGPLRRTRPTRRSRSAAGTPSRTRTRGT